MQFSDASGFSGIVQETDFWVDTDDTTYPIAHKTRNANNRYREILTWIWECYDGWQFNDSNQTDDTLYADQTLNSGTLVYAIPASGVIVTGVEVKDAGGAWHKLMPVTQDQIQQGRPLGDYDAQSGFPLTYQLIGDSIKIDPNPNYTLASALRVYFLKDIVPFVVTDTTPSPGIPAMFHRALSLGMALDFALANKPEKVSQFESLYYGLINPRAPHVVNPNSQKAIIQKFYSHRFHEFNPPRFSIRDAGSEFK